MQVLEQVQEQKQLTFADICPQWDKKLRGWRNSHLDMRNARTCIVGEAWDFNGDYFPMFNWETVYSPSYLEQDPDRCATCAEFSTHFPWSYNLRKTNPTNFENLQDAFVRHWNEKHVSS